jgi:2'-5' RNA ligase
MQAIVSTLDKQHNARIESLWSELEREFGLKYACVAYPHFSYQVAEAYDELPVLSILRDIASEMKPFTVQTSGLGIFTGERPVLFVRVIRDARLSALHDRVGAAVAPYATGVHSHHYGHPYWVPHITLAIEDLTHDNLPDVIRLLSRRSFMWEITVHDLALVRDASGTRDDWVCIDFEKPAPARV